MNTRDQLWARVYAEMSMAAMREALMPSFEYVGVSLRVSQEDHAAIRSALAGLSTSLHMVRAALAEELSAWDIDPPLHHVKEAHDACEAWLAAPSAVQPLSEVPSKGAL